MGLLWAITIVNITVDDKGVMKMIKYVISVVLLVVFGLLMLFYLVPSIHSVPLWIRVPFYLLLGWVMADVGKALYKINEDN